MPFDVQQITGTAQPLVQLLSNVRYGLEFYQREYSWEDAQVTELIDDLTSRFLHQYDSAHERRQVASYRPYFLGPIVTTPRDGVRYLVDGQQRITTLSLLLIYLRRCLSENYANDAGALESLIFSSSYGEKTFNLDVDERNDCLKAILDDQQFDPQTTTSQSVRNMWNRYEKIAECFPEDLQDEKLPYFVDWIQNRVILVDIGTPDHDMALEIFETMNDRGLRLNSIDMLKSYLLARVDENQIADLNDRWRHRVTELSDTEKNADAEFVKAWLRGKYAQTQRERKANSSPGDFDIIGTAFHKWVRDNACNIGLQREADYQQFVERGFLHLSSRYLLLLRACQTTFEARLATVYYVAQTGFTLLLPVILAAITPDDDDTAFFGKAKMVAGALDIYLVRRMVNNRNIGYSTVVYTMFTLIKEIRDRPIDELRTVLASWLEREHERLDGIRSGSDGPFRLTQRNRKYIRYILARITSWLDGELGTRTTLTEYFDRTRRHPYEVEHVLPDHYDRHSTEFQNEPEFQEHRNRLGALLLLPKDFNASYGDMPYLEKVNHYYSQNPLARSLHPLSYENNPSFRRLMGKYDVQFEAESQFSKSTIDRRQKLYQRLAEVVWDPARFGLTLNTSFEGQERQP